MTEIAKKRRARFLRTAPNDVDDYYNTPWWVVELLWKRVEVSEDALILEPCVGSGAIVAASPPGYRWFTVDIDPQHHADLHADFLTLDIAEKSIDWCITNPPYNKLNPFIEKICYSCRNAALLVPITVVGSKRRRELIAREKPELLVFSERINFRGNANPITNVWALFGECARHGIWSLIDE